MGKNIGNFLEKHLKFQTFFPMKMKQFDSQLETILEHGYLSDLQQISLELGIKLVHFHRKEVCDSKIVSKLLLMLLRAGVETRIFRHMFFIIK